MCNWRQRPSVQDCLKPTWNGLPFQVGFFPDDASENFEGRRYLEHLSALTGGTFQEYNPLTSRIYREGVGFVTYDKK